MCVCVCVVCVKLDSENSHKVMVYYSSYPDEDIRTIFVTLSTTITQHSLWTIFMKS